MNLNYNYSKKRNAIKFTKILFHINLIIIY